VGRLKHAREGDILFPSSLANNSHRPLVMAVPRPATLEAELAAHGARALELARDSRPRNTAKTYAPKQKEWQVR
jgi:hypothetical protein